MKAPPRKKEMSKISENRTIKQENKEREAIDYQTPTLPIIWCEK